MKTWGFVFAIFTSQFVYAQKLQKSEIDTMLNSLFQNIYNITYLPEEFYICAYSLYENNLQDSRKFGYEISQKCFAQHVEKMQFSDMGKKLMKDWPELFVWYCLGIVGDKHKEINVYPYCNCVQKNLVESDFGFEHFHSEDFKNSKPYQDILSYCYIENMDN